MKSFVAYLAVFALVGALTACATGGGTTADIRNPVGPDKVVYHINDSPAQAAAALRNINNHLEVNPKAKIVVVTHAQGVDFLFDGAKDRNGNPYNIGVEALKSRGVEFDVCEITLRNRELSKSRFIPEVTFVPSGVAEITRLQARGSSPNFRPSTPPRRHHLPLKTNRGKPRFTPPTPPSVLGMDFSSLQPIEAAVTLAVIWIGLGVIGLAFMRAPRLITGFVFPAGALVSLALAATGLWAIGAPPSAAILPAGLPDLPFHVRVDALSGFFPAAAGRGLVRHFAVRLRLLPRHRGHAARAAEPAVPRVPRQHGVRADRRRRLSVHGHLGVDGALLVFPRHHRTP